MTQHFSFLQALLNRHPALGLVYSTKDDGSVEIMSGEERDVPWKQISMRNETEAELQVLIDEEVERKFDVATDPLLRGAVFLAPDSQSRFTRPRPQPTSPENFNNAHSKASAGSVVILTFHRLATDAWSLLILLDDLKLLLQDTLTLTGNVPDFRHNLMEYTHYMETTFANSVRGEEMAAFWDQQLSGDLPILGLSTDYPRPANQSFQGNTYKAAVDRDIARGVVAAAKKMGVTMHTMLLATWMTLLHRYTGQDDIIVGSPMGSQNRLGFDSVVGNFVNMFVVRGQLVGDPTFKDFAQKLSQTVARGMQHADYPFSAILERLKLDHGGSHAPLVQTVLALNGRDSAWREAEAFTPFVNGIGGSSMRLGPYAIESVPLTRQFSQYDITLVVNLEDNDVGWPVFLKYSSDLFAETTIGSLASHLTRLLESIVAEPNTPVKELGLLWDNEWREIVHGLNDTKRDFVYRDRHGNERRIKWIHELVERQVRRTPHAVAIRLEESQLTYNGLNFRANQLARELQAAGVVPGRDDRVGIFVTRSIDTFVSVLAVLKAGAAYVPLDPNYPPERLSYMLQNSAPIAMITFNALKDKLPDFDGTVIFMDDASTKEKLSMHSTANLDIVKASNPLGYVIYTSGSTGKPKGVCLPHRALVNLTMWELSEPGFKPLRTLQFAPISFDVHFQETFTSWSSGGTLILVDDPTRRDSFALLEHLAKHGVQRVFMPFVALNQLSEAYNSLKSTTGPPALMLSEVVTAGEQLQVTGYVRTLFEDLPGCTLHNHYGPSESHVCTALKLKGRPNQWDALPTIGVPIANTQIYIVDSLLCPVPRGVPGELIIAGVCLANGYLNRDDLTDEKFINDTLYGGPQKKMYRSGDLARYDLDKNIEYLGRIDTQVKIRGFRIELGEIETILEKHPEVRKCVVLAREDIPGTKFLAAYIVAGDSQVRSCDIRKYLSELLPDYMVPVCFVFLDALPLTPSGKIDRRALPAPDRDRPEDLEGEYTAPRDGMEAALAGIFQTLLGLKRVGVYDNFFDLGGHSLTVTRLVSRVREKFRVNVQLSSVLDKEPTIAAISVTLRAAGAKSPDMVDGEVVVEALPPTLFQEAVAEEKIAVEMEVGSRGLLSFNQESLWLVSNLNVQSNVAMNIPIACTLKCEANVSTLRSSLQGLVDRHPSLRTGMEMMNMAQQHGYVLLK